MHEMLTISQLIESGFKNIGMEEPIETPLRALPVIESLYPLVFSVKFEELTYAMVFTPNTVFIEDKFIEDKKPTLIDFLFPDEAPDYLICEVIKALDYAGITSQQIETFDAILNTLR